MRISTSALKDSKQTVEVTLTGDETKEYLDPFFQKKCEEEGIEVPEDSNPRKALTEKLGHSEVGKLANKRVFACSKMLAIDESGVDFLLPPECTSHSFATAGYAFKYSMTGTVLPKMSLSDYSPIDLLDVDFTVTDERFEKEFQKLLDAYPDIVPNEEAESAAKGVIVRMDMTTRCDGEPFEQWSAVGALHQIGSNKMPAEFDKQLAGIKPGDAKMIRFDGVLVADPQTTHSFESYVVCTGLYKFAPAEPNDEWVRANFDNFETLEELKDKLRKNMEAEAAVSDKGFDEFYLATMLSMRLSDPVPAAVMKEQAEASYQEYLDSLEKAGVTEEEAAQREGATVQQKKDQVMQASADQLRQGLALDALARQLKLKPGKAELITCGDTLTNGHGKEFYEVLKRAGGMVALRISARRNMAMDWLKANAKRE